MYHIEIRLKCHEKTMSGLKLAYRVKSQTLVNLLLDRHTVLFKVENGVLEKIDSSIKFFIFLYVF